MATRQTAIRLLLLGALALGGQKVASAQTAAPEPTVSAVDKIVVLDWEEMLNLSRAGQSVGEQIRALQEELNAELVRREAELREEEAELATLRDTLDSIAFEGRVREFEEKVGAFRAFAEERQNAIDATTQRTVQELSRQAERILREVIEPLGVEMVLDRRGVLAHNDRDITPVMVDALDRREISVQVELPPEEPPPTAPSAPEQTSDE